MTSPSWMAAQQLLTPSVRRLLRELVWDSVSCLPCHAWALPRPWGWQGTVLFNNKCYFLIQELLGLNELCPSLGSDRGAEREFPLPDLISNAL